MISLSTSAPVRWSLPWREGAAGAPVYLIRAGSVIEREMLEAELAGEHRAGKVFDFHLWAACGSTQLSSHVLDHVGIFYHRGSRQHLVETLLDQPGDFEGMEGRSLDADDDMAQARRHWDRAASGPSRHLISFAIPGGVPTTPVDKSGNSSG